MKINDKVKVEVNTPFGIIPVEFTIISVLSEDQNIFGLIAQNRIIVGQYMIDDTWRFSEHIDLFDLIPGIIPNLVHQNVGCFDHETAHIEDQLSDPN